MNLKVGDRVRLLPACPRTRSFRPAGSLGTVIEIAGEDMPGWVFVKWDDPTWNDADVFYKHLEVMGPVSTP